MASGALRLESVHPPVPSKSNTADPSFLSSVTFKAGRERENGVSRLLAQKISKGRTHRWPFRRPTREKQSFFSPDLPKQSKIEGLRSERTM